LDNICSTLGGRAAEELFIGTISTGAANDLEVVTKQAYAMIVYYGMSEKIPNISYYDSSGQAYGFSKPYSEDRARMIDQEVSRIIAEQYERAKAMLKEHAEGHAELAETLITREVIFTEDVERIFGKRQWTSRTEEILAARSKEEAEAEAKLELENKAQLNPAPADSTTPEPQEAPQEEPAADDSSAEAPKDEPTPPPFKGNN
jgi:cell division protease FtsH